MATARQGTGHERSGDHHGDVFPAIGLYIGGGAVAGAALALELAGLVVSRGSGNPVAPIALGAALGAILGLFAGLSRGVWRPGLPLPAPASSPVPLWDPWLDSGRDVDEMETESTDAPADREEPTANIAVGSGFPAERARVRPRVISPATGEAIRLEDEIGRLIQERRCELVGLIGGPGSGKTTALQHLTAVLPPWALARACLFDEPDDADVVAFSDADCHLVIATARRLPPNPQRVAYHLASWSRDELIEYLLTAHPDRCAAVMTRLKASQDCEFIEGIPELWTIVLDRMARDESIADVRTALRCELAARFDEHPRARSLVEGFCLAALKRNSNLVLNLPHSALSGDASSREQHTVALLRLVRHRPVALLLAADRVIAIAERGKVNLALTGQLPLDLIQESARRITGNTLALQHLEEWISRTNHSAVHPMAASLLHAATPCWRPGPDDRPRLHGAHLDRVAWSRLNLAGVDLRSADLAQADLSHANLTGAKADWVRCRGADLHEALLDSWVALGADLSGADLRSVRGLSANFRQANLANARLTDACLGGAEFQEANIEDADFTDTNLKGAALNGLKLRLARFDGAYFGWADLRECDMEDMQLTAPDFCHANLHKALLTGSRMREASFLGADLRDAGLAEIDWTGANLHGADLRGVNFHLGSARDGLVGSPIACEGSRTGFYTDDYYDLDIKPAEEIRKANLRGADLRGAKIENVDFYLVDLRDAKYTADQAEHFRHCRAILEDRQV